MRVVESSRGEAIIGMKPLELGVILNCIGQALWHVEEWESTSLLAMSHDELKDLRSQLEVAYEEAGGVEGGNFSA